MFSCAKAPGDLFILFQQGILNCHLSCCWRLFSLLVSCQIESASHEVKEIVI